MIAFVVVAQARYQRYRGRNNKFRWKTDDLKEKARRNTTSAGTTRREVHVSITYNYWDSLPP